MRVEKVVSTADEKSVASVVPAKAATDAEPAVELFAERQHPSAVVVEGVERNQRLRARTEVQRPAAADDSGVVAGDIDDGQRRFRRRAVAIGAADGRLCSQRLLNVNTAKGLSRQKDVLVSDRNCQIGSVLRSFRCYGPSARRVKSGGRSVRARSDLSHCGALLMVDVDRFLPYDSI